MAQPAPDIGLVSFYERDQISAIDNLGNPIPCIGCGVSMLYIAAMHNSGHRRKCLCPAPEWGVDDPEFYAVALDRINRAMGLLTHAVREHPLTCTCGSCESIRVLRGDDR